LGEVEGAVRPFSLENRDPKEQWDLRLEEAVQIALANSKVMKSIGGQILGPPEFLTRSSPSLVPTIYDPAVIESDPRGGVEAALSVFDTQFRFINRWEKFTEPRNSSFNQIFPSVRQDDQGTFQWQLSKLNATGGQTSLSHSWVYLDSNSPTRLYASDWTTALRAEFRQPLLQGAGVQFNRINGPGTTPGAFNGVMLARINTDIALCDFEQGVRNLASDVENAYWEVYYAYRQLDAVIAGRDSGLQNWRDANLKLEVGAFAAHEEAQARNQYFIFRAAVERSLTSLYQAESKLRYIMGLASSDGRLIRPVDEPTTAKVVFDWCEAHAEAIARSSELREFRWHVKRRELEIIAAKNFLLPRLDLVGSYQWIGLGQELIESQGGSGDFTQPGSNAFQSMTGGEFGNWLAGIEFSMPLGFRREMSGVRNAQLMLARERARLQEAELEVSHQLAYAIRELESMLVVTQTNFNRRIAARDEVRSAKEKYRAGVRDGTLTNVLDAERRLAEAESDYYRTLVDYNKAIAQVHYRKGSLLEYNGVNLAEGPWPAKAYFDANRRARARDASLYLNYGFTMPAVISRGAINQQAGQGDVEQWSQEPTLAVPMGEPEMVPPGTIIAPDDMPITPAPPPPSPPKPLGAASAAAPATAEVVQGWAPKGTSRTNAARYDLGSMNLADLAGKPVAAAASTSPVDAPAAVQPAAYQAPATQSEGTMAASRVKWSTPASATSTRPSTPVADDAQGWKSKR
jgi:outer membrane protein TolC